MKIVKKLNHKNIWLENYSSNKNLKFEFNDKPFVCMIWNNTDGFISEALIKQILSMNCKYFVLGGLNCESWHDTVDDIYLSSFPDYNPPDSEFVMTTWHENESIEDVIWTTLNITDFEEYHFDEYLIIQINEKFSENDLIKFIDKSLS